jgi:hypothetical protein|tara:strand:- start:2710 stop:3042 length:333 start_codon:yes stop_codon:yes gene_type:complete
VKQLNEIRTIQNSLIEQLAPEIKIIGNSARVLFLTPHSLRLTRKGCKLLESKCRSWTVESPGKLSGNFMELQKKMTYPYYIDKNDMVLFSEKDAFMAKLAGTKSWLKGKS